MIKPKFPTKYLAFTTYFKPSHLAVDIANAITYQGQKCDNSNVYLAYTAKVIKNEWANDYGYFIEYEVIDGNDRWIFADGHFDTPSNLEVGKTYPIGTFINVMGNSGTSAAKHDHFRVTLNSNRVDPLKYCYAYPDQCVGDKETVSIMKYVPVQYYGTPVARDEYKGQVEVQIDNLRARTSPNGEILGYINKGLYNILEAQNNGYYAWFRVEENIWIAYSNEWAMIYEAKPVETPKKNIPELPIDKPTDEQTYDNDKTPTEDTNVPTDGSSIENSEHLNGTKENVWLKILNLIIKLIKLIKGGK